MSIDYGPIYTGSDVFKYIILKIKHIQVQVFLSQIFLKLSDFGADIYMKFDFIKLYTHLTNGVQSLFTNADIDRSK